MDYYTTYRQHVDSARRWSDEQLRIREEKLNASHEHVTKVLKNRKQVEVFGDNIPQTGKEACVEWGKRRAMAERQ